MQFFNNKRPYQYSYKKDIVLFSQQRLTLFLEVQGNILNQLYYYSEQNINHAVLEQFSALAQSIEGVELIDAYQQSWETIVDFLSDEWEEKLAANKLPLVCEAIFHWQKLLDDFLGIPIAQYHNLKKEQHQLICMCFSVYQNEVEEFFMQNPQASLLDITNVLNVTGACQNCLQRVVDIMREVQQKSFDYQQISLEQLDELLFNWEALHNYFKLGIMHLLSLEKNILTIQVANPEKFQDLSWQIEDYLLQQLGAPFAVKFVAS